MQQPCMGEKPSSDAHLVTANQCSPQKEDSWIIRVGRNTCVVKTAKVTYGNSDFVPDIQVCQVGQAGQPVVQESKSLLTEATARREAAERCELAQGRACDSDVADVQSMLAGARAQLLESCEKKAEGCQHPPKSAYVCLEV